jgi:hypothetical protein
MDYSRVYNCIVLRAKNRHIEGYTERHHVVPRCMGGTNDVDNLVDLTAREHFVCHWLLIRIYPESLKLAYAFNLMWASSKRLQKHTPSSRAYREAKEHLSKLRRGVRFTEEHKLKLSKAKKGKKQSPEHVAKRAAAHIGLKRPPRSEEWSKKQSEAHKGKTISDEHKRAFGEYWKGRKRKPFSEEHRRKLSEAKRKKPLPTLQLF